MWSKISGLPSTTAVILIWWGEGVGIGSKYNVVYVKVHAEYTIRMRRFIESQAFNPPRGPFAPPVPSVMTSPEALGIYSITGVPSLVVLRDESTVLVVYVHGNSEDLVNTPLPPGDTLGYLTALGAEMNADVYMPELPGYWRFDDEEQAHEQPSEASAKDAVLRYVQNIPRDKPLVIIGYSLGCSIAIYISDRVEYVHAVLLIAPFTSSLSVFASWNSWFAPLQPFLGCMDSFKLGPPTRHQKHMLMIASGAKDVTCPASHGRALFEQANPALSCFFLVSTANHFDIRQAGEMYAQFRRLCNGQPVQREIVWPDLE